MALALSCGGGQSGTEGSDLTVCSLEQTRWVEPDQCLPFFDQSLNAVTASLSVSDVPGLWLATGTHPELSVSFPALPGAQQVSRLGGKDWVCSSRLDVAAVRLRSSDGVIDLEVPARLGWIPDRDPIGLLAAELPALPEEYVGPALWPLDVTPTLELLRARHLVPQELGRIVPEVAAGSALLLLAVDVGARPRAVTAGLYVGEQPLAIWAADPWSLPSGPPVAFTPEPRLASFCAGAERFQGYPSEFERFPDRAAAREAMAGTWIRCLDHAASSHVGLQLSPDGRWRGLSLEGGELVAGSGFGREGQLDFFGTPDQFQVSLWPFGRLNDSQSAFGGGYMTFASERALVFRAEAEAWPAAVYLPADLPVRSGAPAYQDGERAGAAACAGTEQVLLPTLEDAAALLRGGYVLCSGSNADGATALRFETGRVELLREAGSLIDAGEYTISSMNAPSLSLGIGFQRLGHRFWVLVASRYPSKLWIEDSDNEGQVGVFSALP